MRIWDVNLHVIVLLDFVVTPAREVRSRVIHSKESVRSHESNSITEDSSADGVWRATTTAWIHARLGILEEETGVHFDHIGMIVQLAHKISNLRVGVNIFESVVTLETEEVTHLVQRSELPLSRREDTSDLNDTERLGNHASTEQSGGVFHTLLHDVDQLSIAELASVVTLQSAELALGGLIGDVLLIAEETLDELLGSKLVKRLGVAWEQALEELVHPLLIAARDDGVESVQEVEFGGHLVTDTSRDALGIEESRNLNARVKGPVGCGVVTVGQTTKVVMQGDVDVETVHDTGRFVVSTGNPVDREQNTYSRATWNRSSSCFARAFSSASLVLVGGTVNRPPSLIFRRTSAT